MWVMIKLVGSKKEMYFAQYETRKEAERMAAILSATTDKWLFYIRG